jgi:hypothetical protein
MKMSIQPLYRFLKSYSVGTLLATAVFSSASAEVLPTSQLNATIQNFTYPFEVYQDYSSGDRDVSVADGDALSPYYQAEASVSRLPELRAGLNIRASDTPNSGFHLGSYATLDYTFQVLGSPDSIFIPVRYVAMLTAISYGIAYSGYGAYAQSFLNITQGNRIQSYQACSNTIAYGNCSQASGSSLFISGVIYVMPNSDIVSVSERAAVEGNRYGAAYAFADPYFKIDPLFATTNPNYTLAFSAGISNAPISDVPEVSSWLTMILGFLGVGTILRKRRAVTDGSGNRVDVLDIRPR